MSGVYCIRNTISGRVYVGSAVRPRQRWNLHRSLLARGMHHSTKLQRSWEKYGPDAFMFEMLEQVEPSLLVEREQAWIDKLNAACPRTGFNMAPVAGSSLGRKHPPEVLAKMRKPHRSPPPRTAEHRANLSAGRIGHHWNKGIPKTTEHRAQLSAAKKGKSCPWIAESNRRRKGETKRPLSAETRAKMSQAKKGIPNLKNRGIKKPWLAELNRRRAVTATMEVAP